MDWYLTVTDLKQWTYCPRVVFYQYCMPRLRPMTFKMEAGLEAHEDEKARERRRTGQLYGLTAAERIENVRIQSDTLGLSVPHRSGPAPGWAGLAGGVQVEPPDRYRHSFQTATGGLRHCCWRKLGMCKRRRAFCTASFFARQSLSH